MDIKQKMRPAFSRLEGGLFSSVSKADVGGAYYELERSGVAMMSWADPFYPDKSLPEHIRRALTDAASANLASHYTMPIGSPFLKEKIAEEWKRKNGFEIDPVRNVLITPGSDSGLLYAMMPFIGPGDEVMVPDPSYPSNFLNPRLLGGKTVPVPLDADRAYRLDISQFEKRLTRNTRMVLLTSPNNPTTTVFTAEELEALAAFIVENDLICVCDQAFEDTVFAPHKFISIAALKNMWERTLTVCSFSKGMGLSGLRVGYIVADDAVMDVLFGAAVNVLGATGTIQQAALTAALGDTAFMQEYMEKYDKRRQYAYTHFNEVPGVSMELPQSTFLCWLDVSKLGDSTDIMAYLIKEAKVSLNDGKPYGQLGAGHLRMVIGCYWNDQVVFDAIDRTCHALARYR
ncbi:pyridoxal phosphate-dependent aminotransferase [Treponema sp. OttesenSCG-928-L16]|nr:pyridoxal phosphate-dependent aminotransferase [Treponema sp. OttesenSCG-928-L16]